MNRFKVTGDLLRNFYKNPTTLEKVFHDIERELKSSNQVVCKYILNGLELKEEDEIKFSKISLNEIHTLEYISENQNIVVYNVVQMWIEEIPNFSKNGEILVAKMRKEKMYKDHKVFKDLLMSYGQLYASMNQLKSLLGDSYLAGCQKWSEAELLSLKFQNEASELLKSWNLAEIADLIDFDFNNSLQLWLECLKYIQDAQNHSSNYCQIQRVSH